MSRIYIQNVTKSHQRSRPWPSNRGSPLEQNGFLSILHPIQRLILLNMSSLNFPVETLRAEQNLPADAEHTLVLTPGTSRSPPELCHPGFRSGLGPPSTPSSALPGTPAPHHQHAAGRGLLPDFPRVSLSSCISLPRPPINKRAGCVSLQGIQPSTWVYLDA